MPDYVLGLLEKQSGNISLAAERFIMAKNRGYPALDCQLQIIDLELGRGSWLRALAECGEGLDPELPLPPDFYITKGYAAEIYVMQGYAHDRLGHAEKALHCLIKAAGVKPFEPGILKNLGILYINQEAFETAAVALGQLYSKQGRRDEAYKSFVKAIQVKPKNPLPYFEAGRILFKSGDIPKAKEFFDKYLAFGGDEAKVKAVLSKK